MGPGGTAVDHTFGLSVHVYRILCVRANKALVILLGCNGLSTL